MVWSKGQLCKCGQLLSLIGHARLMRALLELRLCNGVQMVCTSLSQQTFRSGACCQADVSKETSTPSRTFNCACRITIWSLASKSFVYISGPKHATRGIKFSPDGKYMAVAEVLIALADSLLVLKADSSTCCSVLPTPLCCRERSAKT